MVFDSLSLLDQGPFLSKRAFFCAFKKASVGAAAGCDCIITDTTGFAACGSSYRGSVFLWDQAKP